MKKIFSIGIVGMLAMGLAGCYTQFATTQGEYMNNGGSSYGSYDTSGYGYNYGYDSSSTGVTNNYYYYGNQWPGSTFGLSFNYYTPGAWWWNSDWAWMYGWSSWYPSWYYDPFAYYYYPYAGPAYVYGGGYYSPYYYYPYYYYYWYGSSNVAPGRVRDFGDTRGRDNGGYGTRQVVPTSQPGAYSNAGVGASSSSANTQKSPGSSDRTRVGSTPSQSSAPTPSSQPRERTRVNSTPPPPVQSPQQVPESAPPPRVRDSGSTRDGSGDGRVRKFVGSNYYYHMPSFSQPIPREYPVRITGPVRERRMEPDFMPAGRQFVQREFAPSWNPQSSAVMRAQAPPQEHNESSGSEGRTRH